MKFIKSLTVRMKLLQVFVKYMRTRITTSKYLKTIITIGTIGTCLQALKPHRTGVTALSLSVEHKLLASAGEDRTVYLYKVPGE